MQTHSDTITIRGGRLLRGTVIPQGAKNEALQVICATLLTSETVRLENVPEIEDVYRLFDMVKLIGHSVTKIEEHVYEFCGKDVSVENIESPEVLNAFTHMRGSLMTAGPLFARFGKAVIAMPGGDKIGIRSITPHVRVFKDLGATVVEHEEYTLITGTITRKDQLQLKEASVTATANAVMASVLGNQSVTLYGTASEPYVQQLCRMLNGMGAHITGIGSNLLHITGVASLHGTTHVLQPDMIEIGSWMSLAMVVGDGITIKNAFHADLGQTMLEVFAKIGCTFERKGDDMYLPRHERYAIKPPASGKPIRVIYDQIWPGLSPDHISALIVASVHADGPVIIEQRMFENRLLFTDALNRMGASIDLANSKKALIIGIGRDRQLRGIDLSSPDIRAGMALVIAALAADGTSVIQNAYQIYRGYENIIGRLRGIGADVE